MTRRVLVADDSSTIQKVVKIAFSRFPIEMIEAGSFVEALAALGRGSVDCLIIDASLPGASGPDDFKKLSQSSENGGGGIPVLLLVGTYETVDETALKAAGFKYFLKKPFESSDIINLVDQLLGGSLAADTFRAPGESIPPGHTSRPNHATVIYSGYVPPDLPPPATPQPPAPPAAAMASSQPGPNQASHAAAAGGRQPPPPPSSAPPSVPSPPLSSLGSEREQELSSRHGSHVAKPKMPPPPPPVPGGEAPAERPNSGEWPSSELDQGEKAAFRWEAASDEEEDERGEASSPVSSFASGSLPIEESRKGRRAFSFGEGPLDEKSSRLGNPPTAGEPLPMEALKAALAEVLPALVREAVEAYCDRHFKSLAREVIASELRRLADDKAKHLVDN